MQPTPCTPLGRIRQLLRRQSWFYLFVAGMLFYPAQIYWQVRHAANQAHDAAASEALKAFPFKTSAQATAALATIKEATTQAAAAEAAKVVSPSLVFSKMSIAVGVFCLINLLAWAALNMALPVLPDWAKGDYSDDTRAAAVGIQAPVVGFKRTFLSLSPIARILVYFLGFGLQLFAAGLAVYAAFQIQ
jgi:hypothetical protein